MSPSLLEIIGSAVVLMIGSLYSVRLVNAYRAGRKIWKSYDTVSKKMNLEIKKSLNLLSDWPNLFGKVNNRRVYVHPDKGGWKRPSKTIFAVESKIDLSTELIIGISDTDVPEGTKELEIESLNKHNYNLYAKNDIEVDRVKTLFPSDTARKLKGLVEKNQENFRAVIFEPGLVMFSTFQIEVDEENIFENIRDLCKVVDTIEENSSELNEDLENPRIMQIRRGTRAGILKAIFPFLLFGIAAYLIYQAMHDFSLLFLFTAPIFVFIGLIKLLVSFYNEWKYQ